MAVGRPTKDESDENQTSDSPVSSMSNSLNDPSEAETNRNRNETRTPEEGPETQSQSDEAVKNGLSNGVRRMSLKARGSLSKIERAILERATSKHEHDIDDTLKHTVLTHTKLNVVQKKDFSVEVRAHRDVSSFMNESEVLLDIHETDLEPIVDRLLDVMVGPPFGNNEVVKSPSGDSANDTNNGATNLTVASAASPRKTSRQHETVSRGELKSVIFSDENNRTFSETIQAVYSDGNAHYDWEQTWLCGAITVPTLNDRHVGIARLKHPANLGPKAEEVQFVILVLCPSEIKMTKTALETGRTFSTLFADITLRHDLLEADTVPAFKEIIRKSSEDFADLQNRAAEMVPGGYSTQASKESSDSKAQIVGSDSSSGGSGEGDDMKWYQMGRGIMQDLRNRIPYYLDDYKDGIVGKNTIQKTVATTLFLYFSVILPAVALGVLNAKNTNNQISVQQVMVGQTIGALVFSVFAGQPLVVVMTTAPLALFISVIFKIASDFEIDFLAFYAAIGLWNSFFLCLYSIFNMSILMKFSSRSTEEIFSNFITLAFITDSSKNMVKTFKKHYWDEECQNGGGATPGGDAAEAHPVVTALTNLTSQVSDSMMGHEGGDEDHCLKEVSFMSLILMLGTLWLGVTLFNFTKTPFLNKGKREFLSDYALPVAVVVFSVIGSVLFSGVKVKTFPYGDPPEGGIFKLVNFSSLPATAVIGAAGLGFSLSLLFFMDQNISAAMVNSPDNKLVKGNAYHWDLLVIALINGFLCIFGLPFMHAVLPHSPLHVKCMADTEERVEGGYVRSIVVRVRETRLTNLFSNILIGLSMLFLKYVLDYIPTPVLDGLFLYLAVTALYGNQMFERITLFFTEQSAYPPNHYIRRVPQRYVHTFTLLQIGKLAVLCVFGFTPIPYMKMIFPVVILLFLPVRHLLIPMVIQKKYLDVLDGEA